jgi:uncharacterized protein (DUF4415 family)
MDKSVTQKTINIRIDKDVLEWFISQSKDYQTHINAVLRAYYEANKSNKQS